VEVLEGEKDVGSVKLGGILLEAANLTQVEEELATRTILQAKVQFAFSLEREVHLYDKLMIDTFQNTSFIESVFELVSPQNFSLLKNFERVHFLSVLLLDEEHLAIAALANHLDRAEVTHGNGAGFRHRPVTEHLHLVDRLLVGFLINDSIVCRGSCRPLGLLHVFSDDLGGVGCLLRGHLSIRC